MCSLEIVPDISMPIAKPLVLSRSERSFDVFEKTQHTHAVGPVAQIRLIERRSLHSHHVAGVVKILSSSGEFPPSQLVDDDVLRRGQGNGSSEHLHEAPPREA